eukprot:m.9413 g.9413  ORF g.9413 m.9413 type:complete len:541 (-) comp4063_c0_seq1:5827-7449(-)
MKMEEERSRKRNFAEDKKNNRKKKKIRRDKTKQTKVGTSKPLPPHKFVLAPMVGGSELAFRMLCRKYGAQLCYTPMMYASRFFAEEQYRKENFHTVSADRPLVAHFCGNDPKVLLGAARMVSDKVDAIDLNLGCPQRIAHSGHFGSYLLGPEDRHTVLKIVRVLSEGLPIPVFCKIRLLDTVEDTITLCKQLADAGCSLIAVHARFRGTATRRRDGPAHLDFVRAIKNAMGPQFPIITNGNVREAGDVLKNLDYTEADGVMSAEGILDYPDIFANLDITENKGVVMNNEESELNKRKRKLLKKLRQCDALAKSNRQLTTDEEMKMKKATSLRIELEQLQKLTSSSTNGNIQVVKPGSIALASEYLDCVEKYASAPLKTMVFHVRRILKKELTKYQLMEECCGAQSLVELRAIIKTCKDYSDGSTPFVFDPENEKRAKAAAEKRKLETSKRKAYEARMIRKAKREGKPTGYYLEKGLHPPTAQDVAKAKSMDTEKCKSFWRAKFGQHCLDYHLQGCARDRACAFLHFDIEKAEPSWLEEAQ